MRSRLLPLCLLIALAAAPAAQADVVPGEVIVRYEDGTSATQRTDSRAEAGVGIEEALPGGSQKVQIEDGQSVDETVTELESDPKVAYAAPNPIAHASAFIPNDPGPGAFGDWLKVQWNFFGPAGVNAPDAWDAANAAGRPGGAGVTVAVLDTGVAYQSRGRYRRSPDFDLTRFVSGYDYVAGDKFPNDENGHGTHVTGTIAEATNNGKGLTGLAYGATIMPIRVLDSRGAGDAVSIGRAIRFAAKKGAKVINLSLEFDSSITSSDIPEITRAARYANAKGALIVGAAGNQADSAVAYPARAVHFVSVGATTESLCQADYSNSGPGLDVMAPGGGANAPNVDNPRDAAVCQPSAQGRDIFQQTFSRTAVLRRFGLPGGYEGTSMAAPHVSATAALLVATGRLGPNPRPEVIEQRLKLTARDLGPDGPDPRYGAGLIDAGAATGP